MARSGLLFALVVSLVPIVAEAQAPQFPQYRGAGYNAPYQPFQYPSAPQIPQYQPPQQPQSGFHTYMFPNGQMLNCNSFGSVTNCF
jgi:hypothetical protein